MTVFLHSLESRVAKAMTKLFSLPDGDEVTWSEITIKESNANAKAHYALLQGLNDNNIASIIHCESAFEIWSHLVITQEGTS